MTVRAMLPRLLLGLVILACALWLALNRDLQDPAAIEDTIHNLGLWGPAAHVVLFALGTVLFVPGTLFGLAGRPLWASLGDDPQSRWRHPSFFGRTLRGGRLGKAQSRHQARAAH
jgi:hypothetical protein